MSLNVRQNKNQLLFKALNKEDFEKYEITNQPIFLLAVFTNSENKYKFLRCSDNYLFEKHWLLLMNISNN